MFRLFPLTKNSTISSEYPLNNNGLSPQGFVYSSSYSDLSLKDLTTTKENRFLFDFNNSEVESFVSGSTNQVILNLPYSRMVLNGNDNGFDLYPLSSSFEEGYGENFNNSDGVTWTNKNSNEEWVTEGGDFLSKLTSFTLTDDRLTVDITDFLDNEYGFGVLSSGSGVIRASFYTRHTKSEYNPYVIAFVDDYSVSSGSAVLFNSGSFPNEPFELRPFSFRNYTGIDDTISIRFTFEYVYARMKYAYTTYVNYVPDLQYQIVNSGNGMVIVDFNENNKVVVNDGNIIQFSTKNFSEGHYQIYVKWESGINKWISKPIKFFVHG